MLLAPLNNQYTWRLRLRILTAFDPPWLTRYPLTSESGMSKQNKKGKGKDGNKKC